MNKTIIISPLLALVLANVSANAAEGHKSGPFQGPKANTGFVTHKVDKGKSLLILSDDFKAPDTPDPHVQVVDSSGNTYLLDRLMVKGLTGDKLKKTIEVPPYVKDIAKVQIWCAFAETNLGEAAFANAVSSNEGAGKPAAASAARSKLGKVSQNRKN